MTSDRRTSRPPSVPPTFELVPGLEVDEVLLDELLGVIRPAFGRWPPFEPPLGDREYLRWKLEAPDGAVALIGRVEGQPALASVSLTQRCRVRGVERRGRLGGDSAVHPDFQGRGYDTARRAFIVETMEPHFDLSLSYSDNPRIVQGGHRYGEAPFGESIEVLYGPLDVTRSAAEIRARRSSRLPVAAWSVALRGWMLAGRSRYRAPSAGRLAISTAAEFDDRVDVFSQRALAPFDYALVRDRRWLNWRYCDERGGGFEVRIAEDGGELAGYSVTRVSEERGYLIDLLALPGRLDVASDLVRDARGRLRDRGTVGIDAWMPKRHPYRALLRALGFLPTPRDPGYALRGTVRDEAGDGAFLQAGGFSAHLMMGDSDFL